MTEQVWPHDEHIGYNYDRFDPVINVNHLIGSNESVLKQNFSYLAKDGKRHIAIAPMNTDGGTFWTLPRLTRYITGSPYGRFLAAFIIHDWYCKHPELMDRKDADLLFLEMLLYLDANPVAARLMYRGVRVGSAF